MCRQSAAYARWRGATRLLYSLQPRGEVESSRRKSSARDCFVQVRLWEVREIKSLGGLRSALPMSRHDLPPFTPPTKLEIPAKSRDRHLSDTFQKLPSRELGVFRVVRRASLAYPRSYFLDEGKRSKCASALGRADEASRRHRSDGDTDGDLQVRPASSVHAGSRQDL